MILEDCEGGFGDVDGHHPCLNTKDFSNPETVDLNRLASKQSGFYHVEPALVESWIKWSNGLDEVIHWVGALDVWDA